jgi:hypothetical protein
MLCELCGSAEAHNFHHFIPRTLHRNKWFKRRYTRQQLQQGLELCKACHSAIHTLIPDEKELGRNYETRAKLLAHPELGKFAGDRAPDAHPPRDAANTGQLLFTARIQDGSRTAGDTGIVPPNRFLAPSGVPAVSEVIATPDKRLRRAAESCPGETTTCPCENCPNTLQSRRLRVRFSLN